MKPPEDLPPAPPPTPVSPPITSPLLSVAASSDPLESVKPDPDDKVDEDDDDHDDHDDSTETDAAGGSHEEKDHKLVGYLCRRGLVPMYVSHIVLHLIPTFMWGSMHDDIRLHVARSYISSPDSLFSLISSLTSSNHLLLSVPPSTCQPYFYCPLISCMHARATTKLGSFCV